jgi:hypothetical protein
MERTEATMSRSADWLAMEMDLASGLWPNRGRPRRSPCRRPPNSHEGSERVTMSRFWVPTPIDFVVESDALHALFIEHQAHPSDRMLEESVEPAQTARP